MIRPKDMQPSPEPDSRPRSPTLGLFEKRIEGDDSLLELARLRFQQAGMGAEMHAGAPAQLEALLRFRPSSQAPVTVHLPRHFNLVEQAACDRIAEFARCFAGRVRGLILHDHAAMADQPAEYFRAARELNLRLAADGTVPMVFIEYAAGLPPDRFADFFRSIGDFEHLSACIDVGHVGIRQVRKAYAESHDGEDVCALKSNPAMLPQVMEDVNSAVKTALPTVVKLIEHLGSLRKPVHFHLHDGHPLSTFSPFGVSDHLSFLSEIPLPFEFHGRHSAPLLFGPVGLRRITETALGAIGSERMTLTLEIHPTFERRALGDAAPLFAHWGDLMNAETMNHWLSVLTQNHALLIEQLRLWEQSFTRSC
jgi:hypothetical protein